MDPDIVCACIKISVTVRTGICIRDDLPAIEHNRIMTVSSVRNGAVIAEADQVRIFLRSCGIHCSDTDQKQCRAPDTLCVIFKYGSKFFEYILVLYFLSCNDGW